MAVPASLVLVGGYGSLRLALVGGDAEGFFLLRASHI